MSISVVMRPDSDPAKLREKIASLTARAEEAENAAAALRAELAKRASVATELDSLRIEARATGEKAASATAANAALVTDLERVRSELAALGVAKAEAEKTAKDAYEVLKAESEQRLTKEAEERKKMEEQMAQQMKDTAKRVSELDTNLGLRTDELGIVKPQLDAATAELEALRAEHKKLQDDKTKTASAAATERIIQLNAEVDKLKSLYDAAAAELRQLDGARKDITRLMKTAQAAATRADTAEAKLKESEERGAKDTASISKSTASIADLIAKVGAAEKEAREAGERNRKQVADMAKRLSDLEARYATDLGALRTKLVASEDAVREAGARLTEATNRRDETVRVAAEIEAKYVKCNQLLDERTETIKTLIRERIADQRAREAETGAPQRKKWEVPESPLQLAEGEEAAAASSSTAVAPADVADENRIVAIAADVNLATLAIAKTTGVKTVGSGGRVFEYRKDAAGKFGLYGDGAPLTGGPTVDVAHPWAVAVGGDMYGWTSATNPQYSEALRVLPMGADYLVALDRDSIRVATRRLNTGVDKFNDYRVDKVERVYPTAGIGEAILLYARIRTDGVAELHLRIGEGPELTPNTPDDLERILLPPAPVDIMAGYRSEQPSAALATIREDMDALELVRAMTLAPNHAVDILAYTPPYDKKILGSIGAVRASVDATFNPKSPAYRPNGTLVVDADAMTATWFGYKAQTRIKAPLAAIAWSSPSGPVSSAPDIWWTVPFGGMNAVAWLIKLKPSSLNSYRSYPFGVDRALICTPGAIYTLPVVVAKTGRSGYKLNAGDPNKGETYKLARQSSIVVLAAVGERVDLPGSTPEYIHNYCVWMQYAGKDVTETFSVCTEEDLARKLAELNLTAPPAPAPSASTTTTIVKP